MFRVNSDGYSTLLEAQTGRSFEKIHVSERNLFLSRVDREGRLGLFPSHAHAFVRLKGGRVRPGWCRHVKIAGAGHVGRQRGWRQRLG